MELLEEIAGDVNRRYLKGVGSKVVIGDEGAWIGIEMDPKRTKIEGEIEFDKGETYKGSEESPSKPQGSREDPENGNDPNESRVNLAEERRDRKRNDTEKQPVRDRAVSKDPSKS